MNEIDDEKMLDIARKAMSDETPVPVTSSVADAWAIVSALQFTVQIAEVTNLTKAQLKDIAKQFQGAIEDIHPQVTRILNMGWDSAYDAPSEVKATPDKPPLKEVINAFAIYWSDDPAKPHWAETRRPQDWGDPRWMYRVYVLEAQGYRHEAHCYVEHEMSEPEHVQMFAPLFTSIMISYPPRPRELCDRSHLQEDDFWQEEWGPLPPHFDEDSDDFDDDEY